MWCFLIHIVPYKGQAEPLYSDMQFHAIIVPLLWEGQLMCLNVIWSEGNHPWETLSCHHTIRSKMNMPAIQINSFKDYVYFLCLRPIAMPKPFLYRNYRAITSLSLEKEPKKSTTKITYPDSSLVFPVIEIKIPIQIWYLPPLWQGHLGVSYFILQY